MNEQETIADIIAKKRQYADDIERACNEIVAEDPSMAEKANDYKGTVIADIRREANRLEAAHKREKAAIEADALAVGGIVEAAHRRELSKNASKNGADFGQLGDAAKLREALESIASNLEHRLFARYPSSASDEWMYQKAKAALAAPPRNCDKSRDYILAALKHEKNVDPIFTVRLVVDFMLAEAREGGAK